MNNRNTKQKEIILDILHKHRIHPTIQEIHAYAKEVFPNIGQATIYRNVNNLVKEGIVLKLPNATNDSYHYDINVNLHSHLLCKKCGSLIDIFDNGYEKLTKKLEKQYSLKIDTITVTLEGICTKCMKEN